MSKDTAIICDRCGVVCNLQTLAVTGTSIGTGYGTWIDGRTFCYPCCGEMDKENMCKEDKYTLYLTTDGEKWNVGNWPNSFSLPASVKVNPHGHNWGLVRRDAWFVGPDGDHWWGVQYGENTDLVHCRRLKHKSEGLEYALERYGGGFQNAMGGG